MKILMIIKCIIANRLCSILSQGSVYLSIFQYLVAYFATQVNLVVPCAQVFRVKAMALNIQRVMV